MDETNRSGAGTPSNSSNSLEDSQNFYPYRPVLQSHLPPHQQMPIVAFPPPSGIIQNAMSDQFRITPVFTHNGNQYVSYSHPNAMNGGTLIPTQQQNQPQNSNDERGKRPKLDSDQQNQSSQGRLNSEENFNESEQNSNESLESQRRNHSNPSRDSNMYSHNPLSQVSNQNSVKVLFSSPPFTSNMSMNQHPHPSHPSHPSLAENTAWGTSLPSNSTDPFNKYPPNSSNPPIPPLALWNFPNASNPHPNFQIHSPYYDEFAMRNRGVGNVNVFNSPPNSFVYQNNQEALRSQQQQQQQQQQKNAASRPLQRVSSNGSQQSFSDNDRSPMASSPSPSFNFPEGFMTRASSNSNSNSNSMTGSGRFVLKDQPNAFQRKSYKSERRYLTPNPLIICTREACGDRTASNLPRIMEGSVRVELVDGLGRKLDPNKKIFEPSDGQFEQPLNLKSSAEFSLKVLQNSGPDLFCLLFTVNYVTSSGERFVEQIQSRKFVVQSNKALKAKEKPSVIGLKPVSGNNTEEVDVWIKGSEFHRQGILVCFGDRMGKVVEISENLLVVTVPMRADLKERMDVQVTVSNKYRNEVKTADRRLTYSYVPTTT